MINLMEPLSLHQNDLIVKYHCNHFTLLSVIMRSGLIGGKMKPALLAIAANGGINVE